MLRLEQELELELKLGLERPFWHQNRKIGSLKVSVWTVEGAVKDPHIPGEQCCAPLSNSAETTVENK